MSLYRISHVYLVIVLALLWSCDRKDEILPGEDYQVSDEPPPVISEDTLKVHVSYGGCGGARFALRHREERGALKLWLWNTSPRQGCDMVARESLSFELPPQWRTAARVLFVTPAGRTHVLR